MSKEDICKEEYVLQFCGDCGDEFLNVKLTNGDYSTSSYMEDIDRYESLELARLAVAALHSRYEDLTVRILRIKIEEVKDKEK